MSKIVAEYVADTGEKFSDALRRLQGENFTGYDAAIYIGFNSKQSLDYAMKIRGIDIQFRGVKLPGVSRNAAAIKTARQALKRPKPLKQPKSVTEHPWRRAEREAHEKARRTASA